MYPTMNVAIVLRYEHAHGVILPHDQDLADKTGLNGLFLEFGDDVWKEIFADVVKYMEAGDAKEDP